MTSNILDRGMTIPEARAMLAKTDRQSWYAGTQAHHAFAVMSSKDSREVFRAGRRDDRDQILAMVRAHDAMRESLETLVNYISENDQDGLTDHAEPMTAARAALKLAAAVK